MLDTNFTHLPTSIVRSMKAELLRYDSCKEQMSEVSTEIAILKSRIAYKDSLNRIASAVIYHLRNQNTTFTSDILMNDSIAGTLNQKLYERMSEQDYAIKQMVKRDKRVTLKFRAAAVLLGAALLKIFVFK